MKHRLVCDAISRRLHRDIFAGVLQMDPDNRDTLISMLIGHIDDPGKVKEIHHLTAKDIMNMSDEQRKDLYDDIIAKYGIHN